MKWLLLAAAFALAVADATLALRDAQQSGVSVAARDDRSCAFGCWAQNATASLGLTWEQQRLA
ncbi:MAG TPA: hypothetical protein VHS58_18545 [Acetobacteraceae bacterium]|jgi:hypothetical protein|nr:hypothetical protein [Acetobacteraceae bacterium]